MNWKNEPDHYVVKLLEFAIPGFITDNLLISKISVDSYSNNVNHKM